eukprot:CAMPEP_0184336678 /NCGR_PEP_ID=MMETSP1089-20130417/4872_1 /TAXON_ID=38269 ORGANISM="Gloeochaete wittrockiana, Strain SAG46.84" /NCGR_SAMPLE_ID=MMETSP1089 /ASSEMBLY_ACC=CAM_ASM_000445 /LENGTH=134 /DNA_ID=CAMNT_0026661731 /DNA_START=51 /DNA_END=455 /DNA_ORIENTATION=+
MTRGSEDGRDNKLEDLNLHGQRVGVLEAHIHSITDIIGVVKVLVEAVNEAVVIVGGSGGRGLAIRRNLLADLIEERALRGRELVERGGDVARVSVVLVVELATENEFRVWVEGDVEVGGVAGVNELVKGSRGGG